MLALDIEWLLGVCFAARSLADATPDWPPQPDRIFSALIASWGARGAPDRERDALTWLESLAPPDMEAAPDCHARTGAQTFVPPNDPAAGDIRILPARRRRQPRRFPATILSEQKGGPHLRLVWQTDPSADQLASLDALARDTSYIGHSSSLVRCAFLGGRPENAALQPVPVTGAPYPGRLRELEALHARHVGTADAAARPSPAPLVNPATLPRREVRASVFGRHWTVLAYASGDRPDIRAAAVIGRAMRDSLMSKWGDPIPEWLSGHSSDGTPSREAHLAVIPLAHVGHQWSDGTWHGLALVLPRAREEAWVGAATQDAYANRQRFNNVLRSLSPPGAEPGTIELRLGSLGLVRLRLLDAPEQVDLTSLHPRRYQGQSARWTTATPIILDRHPKSSDTRAEAADMIAGSCIRIGLPKPERVLVHKHAAVTGAPSAWPAGGAPRWSGWARPGSLASRPVTHATIQFGDKVQGPVILGAGRFFGLGLCLPLTEGAAS